jgi:hypothetical protein
VAQHFLQNISVFVGAGSTFLAVIRPSFSYGAAATSLNIHALKK